MYNVPWGIGIVVALLLVGTASAAYIYTYVLYRAMLVRMIPLVFILMSTGLLVLLLDLGQPLRFINAVTHFNVHSVLSIGVFVQSFYVALLAVLWYMLRYQANNTKRNNSLSILALLLSVAVVLYHGILPVSMQRAGYDSMLIAVMAFSSLLSGKAVVELYLGAHIKHNNSITLSMMVGFYLSLGLYFYVLSTQGVDAQKALVFITDTFTFSTLLFVLIIASGTASLFLMRYGTTKLLVLFTAFSELSQAFLLKYAAIISGQLSFLAR